MNSVSKASVECDLDVDDLIEAIFDHFRDYARLISEDYPKLRVFTNYYTNSAQIAIQNRHDTQKIAYICISREQVRLIRYQKHVNQSDHIAVIEVLDWEDSDLIAKTEHRIKQWIQNPTNQTT
jgi:hypothetical protein